MCKQLQKINWRETYRLKKTNLIKTLIKNLINGNR